VVDLAVNQGRQTDARVADASETDNVGLPGQPPLHHVVVGDLPHQQGSAFTTAFDYEELHVIAEAGASQGLTVVRRLVTFEIIGPAKAGPRKVKRFSRHGYSLSLRGQGPGYQIAEIRESRPSPFILHSSSFTPQTP